MPRRKWVVEFEVDDVWVADGFDLTEERAKAMIESEVPYAFPSETAAKIVSRPSEREIEQVMDAAINEG